MSPLRLLAWFTAVLALGLAGRWQTYHARADRCALDGRRIVPVRRVDLVAEDRVAASFCRVRCALDWPGDIPGGARWRVRDLVAGEPLDASVACFVRGEDGIRTFRDWVDAHAHVEAHGGERIADPFPTASPREPER